MKFSFKKVKSVLVPIGIILGIVLLIHLFSPYVYSNLEGFVEGNTASTTTLGAGQKCTQATQKCEKEIRDHIIQRVADSRKENLADKHFKNGDITKDFISYVKTTKIDIDKNTNCKDFSVCEFTKVPAQPPSAATATPKAPSPSSSPSPSPAPSTSSTTSQPSNADIMGAIQNLTERIS